jgi:hypothetical protein
MLFSLLTDIALVFGVFTAAVAFVRGLLAIERELEERRDRRANRRGR